MAKTKIYYLVAGHYFALNLEESDQMVAQLTQYEPFRVQPETEVQTVFELDVVEPAAFPVIEDFKEEIFQDDEGTQIAVGHDGQGRPCFEFSLRRKLAARMLTNDTYSHGTIMLDGDRLFGINNAIMVMYALSTSHLQTALFHSSVVSYQGKGYMFLGKSGTGKSTHSKLWLKHIEGTELMNDDNPVVRFIDGQAWVFGSPWSGKTPCYRNVQAPIGAIVKLDQAPHNVIRRLKGLQAYSVLVPSISGKRWDKRQADGLHETENLLASHVNIFHLDCLPDEDAARTCLAAVTNA